MECVLSNLRLILINIFIVDNEINVVWWGILIYFATFGRFLASLFINWSAWMFMISQCLSSDISLFVSESLWKFLNETSHFDVFYLLLNNCSSISSFAFWWWFTVFGDYFLLLNSLTTDVLSVCNICMFPVIVMIKLSK